MVGTIGPVVYGRRNHLVRYSTVGLYVASHIAGGAALGGLASSLGALFRIPLLLGERGLILAFISLCLLSMLRDALFPWVPLSLFHWQVPRHWSLLPPLAMSLLYGFILGLGFFTRINNAAFYAAVGGCFLIGSPASGALIMMVYGLVRSTVVLYLTHKFDNSEVGHISVALTEIGAMRKYFHLMGTAVMVAVLFALVMDVMSSQRDMAQGERLVLGVGSFNSKSHAADDISSSAGSSTSDGPSPAAPTND